MGIGLAVAMLLEGFQIAAQIIALQAGYAYASMIDPGSEADSGILQVWTQLAAAFLFFAAGLDHAVIRAVAAGLQTPAPAGGEPVAAVSKLGTEMFALSVRLAFPVVVLVLLLDVALALTGRMQAQLQLLALAFPAKMLAAILLLSFLTAAFPPVFERAAAVTLRLLPALAR
jgi:flagellar biosynthetic protein FliR